MDTNRAEPYASRVQGGTSLEVVCHEGRNCVAIWENLVIAVWGDAPGARPIRAIHDAHLDLLQLHERVGHLVLIHGPPRLPPPEARSLSAHYSRQSRMSSIAVVVDGEGFWLSTARGFLTAVLFMQRSPAPTQVFKDLPAALHWQEGTLGEDAPRRSAALLAVGALRELSEHGRLPAS